MKRIATVLARSLLVAAVACAAARCGEKPEPIVPLISLAGAQGGGRIYFDTISIPPSATSWIGTIYERSTIWGDLDLPPIAGFGRVPAVILVPDCDGVGAALHGWSDVLQAVGYATFRLDSFGGREVKETCTGQQVINVVSLVGDIYNAQALLATHPSIDPARIAVMGFGTGGWAAAWAALTRYQRQLKRAGTMPIAAYLAFYPTLCAFHLRDETEIAGGPIRLFHGTADDAMPLPACRDWAQRMRAAGRDVGIYEYAGARHGFDVPAFSPPRAFADYVNFGNCDFSERPDGAFVDRATGARPAPNAACAARGYTQGYDAVALKKSIEDVKALLAVVFRTGGG